MADIRHIKEGRQTQGTSEELIYTLTTTPWGSDPTDVLVTVLDVTIPDRDDVTETVTTGSPSVAGDVITLPVLHSLEDGHRYEVRVKFTDGNGNTWEAIAEITGVL